MKLPNAESAIIEHGKIVDYLLNPSHPDNGGKAAFFSSCGFMSDNWAALASAFRGLAATAEVAKTVETLHGCKYILDGRIGTPAGKSPTVRTVWIIDRGDNAPRLITAYPGED